jgi:hypothetical protein
MVLLDGEFQTRTWFMERKNVLLSAGRAKNTAAAFLRADTFPADDAA